MVSSVLPVVALTTLKTSRNALAIVCGPDTRMTSFGPSSRSMTGSVSMVRWMLRWSTAHTGWPGALAITALVTPSSSSVPCSTRP